MQMTEMKIACIKNCETRNSRKWKNCTLHCNLTICTVLHEIMNSL